MKSRYFWFGIKFYIWHSSLTSNTASNIENKLNVDCISYLNHINAASVTLIVRNVMFYCMYPETLWYSIILNTFWMTYTGGTVLHYALSTLSTNKPHVHMVVIWCNVWIMIADVQFIMCANHRTHLLPIVACVCFYIAHHLIIIIIASKLMHPKRQSTFLLHNLSHNLN